MKKWWDKIKEHPIYSKVAAQLITWMIIGIIGLVFSWIYFPSLSGLANQKWIVTTWGFLLIGTIIIIVSFLSPILFFKKAKVSTSNKTQGTENNQQIVFHERVRVVREVNEDPQYLIDNSSARHIPDPETFVYLGQLYQFDWGSTEVVTRDYFEKQFTLGNSLPSIRPYCEAFHREKMREEPLWEHPFYSMMKDGKKDGPFCQCCYDKDKKLVRLQSKEKGFWECKVCNNSYIEKNFSCIPEPDSEW